jgi:hypothetical protein
MIDNVPTWPLADQVAVEATIDRRRHDRIAGPFDGVRVGALETALNIFDLSLGGCFVNATHEQAAGVRFVMKIALPYVGLITLKAETLSQRSELGFAVRFVDLNEETASRLDQALQQLRARALQDE